MANIQMKKPKLVRFDSSAANAAWKNARGHEPELQPEPELESQPEPEPILEPESQNEPRSKLEPEPVSAERSLVRAIPSVRRMSLSPKVFIKNRLMFASHNDAVEECYRMLRTQVLHKMKANNWTTLAITSPLAGTGKTVTAINLAIQMSRNTEYTTILIDADLRRPSVGRTLGLEPITGVDDYLSNTTSLKDLIICTEIDRLGIIPVRETRRNSSELISSPKMNELIESIRRYYDPCRIVFDLPPLLNTDDALSFSAIAECMLLVVEDGKTQNKDMKHSLEMLADVNLLGTVLNKSSERSRSYYY